MTAEKHQTEAISSRAVVEPPHEEIGTIIARRFKKKPISTVLYIIGALLVLLLFLFIAVKRQSWGV